ncbi:hypothetical protein [Butyrivibrio sp. YAB3001]|uniref:hypothetical protein n=1 Tax=Butyrivibrio sp. YAB3001 TaxID=1520812 RepID=UPI0008F666A0|nr:hypothetical protein [Butyrivibrio sp. YAB3001]SFC42294.1 hypothetical protein SAMN02910398_02225 [Butyrivibrio sp. YAB3001]
MQESIVAQKKRNRPIAITDVAIEKVPRTHIFGFTNEQNQFIQEMHREVLRVAKELCEKYKSNSMEAVILLDSHTWDSWIIKGKKDRIVDIKNNPKAKEVLDTSTKNSLLLLHNHPSTGTFSARDLRTFCNNDSLYIMTVVGNDGSVYVLMKNVGFDPSAVLEEYGRLAEQFEKQGCKYNATEAIKYMLKNAEKYNMSYKKGRKKI